MSNLWLPRRQVQMSRPVVFWFSKKLDHIMCPPSPIAPPPIGYEKIECHHAVEVDMWSRRLRRQETRIREMTDGERFEFEEKIRAHMMTELRLLYQKATDPVNREFLAVSIRNIQRKRELRQKEVVQTFMHCEAQEGVAS